MAFYKCSGGGVKPWPKFIRQVDNNNTVWQYWLWFDVSELKTVTIRYKISAGDSGRVIFCITDLNPLEQYTLSTDSKYWNLTDLGPAAGKNYETMTVDVSKSKYLGLCSRHTNAMIYEIVSVT